MVGGSTPFCDPQMTTAWVYQQLRKNGHVHRPVIGAGLQTITPPMAAALKLPCDKGDIVSDLQADSPAGVAGVKLNDIVLSVNDRPLDNVAGWIQVGLRARAWVLHVCESPAGNENAVVRHHACRHGAAERAIGRPCRVVQEPDLSTRHHGRHVRRTALILLDSYRWYL